MLVEDVIRMLCVEEGHTNAADARRAILLVERFSPGTKLGGLKVKTLGEALEIKKATMTNGVVVLE